MSESPLPRHLFDATEEIDASLFSGDTFHAQPERRAALRQLMSRWSAALTIIEEAETTYRPLIVDETILPGDQFKLRSLSADHWGPCDLFTGEKVGDVHENGRIEFRRRV